jgi:glycolate oxidase subunit GlcD
MTPELLTRFARIVGEKQLLSDPADCWPYGYDNSRRHCLPEAVVFPATHQHVIEIIKLCNQHSIALVARGRGTGTTGATVPLHGGLVASFERMDRIVTIDPDNRVAVVEPGVTNLKLQEALAEHGFFWPPDPTSAAYCTIGGNLAYNSAGPRAVKYGTPRENTLGLRAVTGAGDDISTGVYTTKGVVGYDLTRLIIGSEGTLAVITQASLKLTPLQEAKRTMQAVYNNINEASKAVSRIMAQSTIPCALEFMDASAIALARNYSGIELPHDAVTLLMIEVDGNAVTMDAAITQIKQAARNDGLINFKIATTADEVTQLWAARKALSPALRTIAPKKINEDIVVPVSRIPDLITGLESLARRYAITIVNFGHAGNGNIHVNLLVDPDDPAQVENVKACLNGVFGLVLELQGTLSGEHGIGIEKRDFIEREIDPVTLKLMRQIKAQFDPHNILNPGKIFPLQ